MTLRPVSSPALIALCGVVFTGCIVGNGDVVTDAREVGSFSAVELSGSVDADVFATETETRVDVTCDANLQEHIRTRVRGGQLEISTKNAILNPSADCYATVYLPAMDAASTSGSGDLWVRRAGAVRSLTSSGSGNVVAEGLDTASLQAETSGSGELRLEGHADTLRIRSSGSGDVSARDLEAVDVSVDTSGSGDVIVH